MAEEDEENEKEGSVIFRPETEGEDHINAYSHSRTALGLALSNFAHLPMVTEDGYFASMEGLWYWLGSPAGVEREALRDLYGFDAKQEGRRLARAEARIPEVLFTQKILRAAMIKVLTHRSLADALAANTLPIVHYYVYNGRTKNAGVDWLWQRYEQMGELLRCGWL